MQFHFDYSYNITEERWDMFFAVEHEGKPYVSFNYLNPRQEYRPEDILEFIKKQIRAANDTIQKVVDKEGK